MSEHYCQKDVDRLQCPFNWDLSQYDVDKITWNLNEVEEFIPDITFTRFLTSAYVKILKLEYDKADKKLEEAEQVINEIKSQVKKDVSRHIFDSTKIHFMIKKGNLKEVGELLKAVESIDDKIYVSPLNEFLASFWTLANYSTETTNIAMNFAKIAIQHDPKAATAHYLLGRNLRTLRRLVSIFTSPKMDELTHFREAYEIEKNPKFALFVAQSLKESRKWKEAMKMFNEIHDMNLQSVSIQLRLALAFLQNYNFNKAKTCLDYVASVSPESMFLHYKGLYLMKMEEYEEASKYLLKATADNNFRAEMCYLRCMKLLNGPFDFTSYLFKVQEKYSHCEIARQKEILIHIAFSYFHHNQDFEESMKYFLRALEIEEEELPLKNFSCKFENHPTNVYHFVIKELLPKIQGDPEKKNHEETIEMKEKLTKICKQHIPYRPPMFNKKIEISGKFQKLNI